MSAALPGTAYRPPRSAYTYTYAYTYAYTRAGILLPSPEWKGSSSPPGKRKSGGGGPARARDVVVPAQVCVRGWRWVPGVCPARVSRGCLEP